MPKGKTRKVHRDARTGSIHSCQGSQTPNVHHGDGDCQGAGKEGEVKS